MNPGSICSNCKNSNLRCTHDEPRQPTVSYILPTCQPINLSIFVETGNPASVRLQLTCAPVLADEFNSYIQSLKDRLSKLERVLRVVSQILQVLQRHLDLSFIASSRQRHRISSGFTPRFGLRVVFFGVGFFDSRDLDNLSRAQIPYSAIVFCLSIRCIQP